MTALIAAMNKRLVALASDSALTISSNGTHKVINSANKLMPLSKFNPVGIMFCGNATYMEVPWEVLVKEYRHQRRDKSFTTLNEYKDDFVNFLISNNHFCSDSWQLSTIKKEAIRLNNIFITKYSNLPPNVAKIGYENELNSILKDSSPKDSIMTKLTADVLTTDDPNFFSDIFATPLLKDDVRLQNIFKDAFVHFLKRQNSKLGCTSSTIVIAGYGENEIYPHLRSFEIWFGFKDIVRIKPYINQDITDVNDASLSTYAQTDVINSFIYGIHPKMSQHLIDCMTPLLSKILENVASSFADESVKKKIKEFDTNPSKQLFSALMERAQRDKFSNPMINSITYLDREDLANLVESLVSLTGLNRRFTGMEEGVGGPTDVAIITKGDGFIWMKRKHYFTPELNRNFFTNYFNH